MSPDQGQCHQTRDSVTRRDGVTRPQTVSTDWEQCHQIRDSVTRPETVTLHQGECHMSVVCFSVCYTRESVTCLLYVLAYVTPGRVTCLLYVLAYVTPGRVSHVCCMFQHMLHQRESHVCCIFQRMLHHLKEKKDVGFFVSVAGLMKQCNVLDLDAFERCNKAEGLGVADGQSSQERNQTETENTIKLFRCLQLLCEGHNLRMFIFYYVWIHFYPEFLKVHLPKISTARKTYIDFKPSVTK